MKEDQGCLFGVENTIYYWRPEMEAPKVVAVRPGRVMSITGGWVGPTNETILGRVMTERQYCVFDTGLYRQVYLNLNRKLLSHAFDRDIYSLVLAERTAGYPSALEVLRSDIFGDQHEALILLTRGHSRKGERWQLIFTDIDEKEIATAWTDSGSYPEQAVVTSRDIFWVSNGTIFRGLGTDKVERKTFGCHQTILVANGDNFLILHYWNEETHPEGAVLSTRDNRTVLTYDPDELGSYRLGGIFRADNRQHLFLATIQGMVESIYTRTIREGSNERAILTWRTSIERTETWTPYDNSSNPFLAIDHEVARQMIEGL